MHSGKTKAGKEQPVHQLAAKGIDAAKGYAAVTQFMQPPAAKHTAGNALPKQLKSGIEGLSGLAMDDVQVHYNSHEPASFGALASAEGNRINLAPGQEKHLPHEAWHVVQQKQGRVKPILQAKGLAINNDKALETEADVMGLRAVQLKTAAFMPATPLNSPFQPAGVVQRKIGFEFQAYDSIYVRNPPGDDPVKLGHGLGFEIETDGGAAKNELEIVTDAVDETMDGFKRLGEIMDDIVTFVTEIEDGKKLTLIEKPVTWHNPSKLETSVFSIPKKEKHFHPQATVGVKFEKVAALIVYVTKAPFKRGGERIEPGSEETKDPTMAKANIFGWSSKDDQRPFRRAWADGLRQAEDIKGDNPKEKGFAAIMYGFEKYKKSGALPDDRSSIKYFMPFLLRNGFLPFYKALNGPQNRDIKRQLSNNYEVIFDGSPSTAISGFDPTRIGFLMELLQTGEDYVHRLTESHGQINKDNYRDWGKMEEIDDIGMSDTEEVGEKRRGAIIELRKLGNDVPPKKLKEFAEAVFILVRRINTPNAPRPNELTPGTKRALSALKKQAR